MTPAEWLLEKLALDGQRNDSVWGAAKLRYNARGGRRIKSSSNNEDDSDSCYSSLGGCVATSTIEMEMARAITMWEDASNSVPASTTLQQEFLRYPSEKIGTTQHVISRYHLSESEIQRLESVRKVRRKSYDTFRSTTGLRRHWRNQSWPLLAQSDPVEEAVWVEMITPPMNDTDTLTPAWMLSDEYIHHLEFTQVSQPDSSSRRASSPTPSAVDGVIPAWFSRQQSSKLTTLFTTVAEDSGLSSHSLSASIPSADGSNPLLGEEFEVDCRFREGQPLPLSSDEGSSGSFISTPRSLAPWTTSLTNMVAPSVSTQSRDQANDQSNIGDPAAGTEESQLWVRLCLYLPPYHVDDGIVAPSQEMASSWNSGVQPSQLTHRCKFNVRILREATVGDVLEGLREILRRVVTRDKQGDGRHGAANPNLSLILACVWELHPAVDDYASDGFYFQKRGATRRLIRRPDLNVAPLNLSMTVTQMIATGTTDFAVSVVDTPTLPNNEQPPPQHYADRDVGRYVASLHRKIGIGIGIVGS